MRRGTSIAGTVLLIVVLAVSLAGCEQAAPSRAPSTVEAAITQPGVQPQPGASTPRPGETVVTVFTTVPQTPSGAVTPTQDLGLDVTPVAGATAVPGQAIEYVVQSGDTLQSIANKHNTTVAAIVEANKITDPDAITPGQKLTIPAQSGSGQTPSGGCRIRHTVQSGEWIWQIARTYGADPYAILEANDLTVQTGSTIQPGQVLCIP